MTNSLNKSVELYEHPEGATVEFWNNQLIVADDNGNCVSTTIDKEGLSVLANKIKAMVKDSDKAEKFGANIGSKLIDELIKLKGDSAESFSALKKAITKLVEYDGNYRDDVVGGFCVTFSPLVRIGAVNVLSSKVEYPEDEVF